MANEFSNAITLMESDAFYKWCKVATVYQARVVLTEATSVTDHDVRLKMAKVAIANPEAIVMNVVNAIACDPEVAALGTTPEEITQSVFLNKIAALWTFMAKMLYAPSTL